MALMLMFPIVILCHVVVWAIMFVFYLVCYFVIVFFNVALVHCARRIFNGQFQGKSCHFLAVPTGGVPPGFIGDDRVEHDVNVLDSVRTGHGQSGQKGHGPTGTGRRCTGVCKVMVA